MDLPKFTAPTVSISPQTSLVSVAKTSIPSVSSPTLSIGSAAGSNPLSLASITSNTGIPTNLAGAASSINIPTTAGGISSALGGPTSLAGGLNSAGIPTTLPNFSSTLPPLPSLKLQTMPNFPGIDQAGVLLGAGPKFAAEKIAKFKTIVPPFAPGLKLNMGMVAGAMAVIKAISSGNPAALLQQLTANIADDIKGQIGDITKNAIDSAGVTDIQNQVQGMQDSIQSTVSDATNTVQEGVSSATGAVQEAAGNVTSNTSGGAANLNLSAVSSPITNPLSSPSSIVNDKISSFTFPPSG